MLQNNTFWQYTFAVVRAKKIGKPELKNVGDHQLCKKMKLEKNPTLSMHASKIHFEYKVSLNNGNSIR